MMWLRALWCRMFGHRWVDTWMPSRPEYRGSRIWVPAYWRKECSRCLSGVDYNLPEDWKP